VGRALGLRPDELSPAQARAYRAMAPALDAIPDLARWPREDRAALAQIVRAKAGREERRYLRLMQKHPRLRAAWVRLGSVLNS